MTEQETHHNSLIQALKILVDKLDISYDRNIIANEKIFIEITRIVDALTISNRPSMRLGADDDREQDG